MKSLLRLVCFGLLAFSPAFAADPAARKAEPPQLHCAEKSELPTDVFGFTNSSDFGGVDSKGVSLAYVGAFGRTGGPFRSHALTGQFAYGLAPCLELGPYLVGAHSRDGSVVPALIERSFGAGVEAKYKLFSRDLHGFGMTLVLDPSHGRSRVSDGTRFSATNVGLRVFIDREIVPGKFYGAVNLSHDLTWAGAGRGESSMFTIGVGLAVQLFDGFYLGAEMRHLRAHGSLGFSDFAGYATFAGPTFLWALDKEKTVVLSGAWNTQLHGHAAGAPGDLDLVNFTRHVAKLKLSVGF